MDNTYQIYLNDKKTKVISKYLSDDILKYISLFLDKNLSQTKIFRSMIKDFALNIKYYLVIAIRLDTYTTNENLGVSEIYYFFKKKDDFIQTYVDTEIEPLWSAEGNLNGFNEFISRDIIIKKGKNIYPNDFKKVNLMDLYVVEEKIFEECLDKLKEGEFKFKDEMAFLMYRNLNVTKLNEVINICDNLLNKRIFPKKSDIEEFKLSNI